MPRKRKPTRNELVALEVEKWDRTPFAQQQCCKGAGVDCKMLPAGIARDLGFPEADSFYALTREYDVSRAGKLPHDLLVEGMAALFDRVEDIIPGDLLLLKVEAYGYRPGHIAIASRNEGRAWHAQIRPNPYVKEASLAAILKICPLHSVWRWRNG
jgi:hypothetical protein